ncbi:fringe-like protein [Actinidia rufa]|uniref:Fringe-like protein n=1 Tax=Actinidia rufa TaxID=165716 RepID=A0A7J0H556_9ERIC|nr:fringe-like protein [Actinidia rufa]
MASLAAIKFSALKQNTRFLSDNFLSSVLKVVAISGLCLYLVYLAFFNYSNCPSSKFFSTLNPKQIPTDAGKRADSHANPNFQESPTNISHLVFGLVSAVKTWKDRKPYIDAWWQPNITRGYLILDKPPTPDFLPWPSSSPPLRVSDDTSKLERESKHVSPIMVRMVHSILETFREGDKGVRWYVMAFDDSVLFVENWVDVLNKYDHTKYFYIGDYSETVLSNLFFSFDQGFGGAGIALSYPLAAAMVKDLKGCIRRYPFVKSADTIIQFCVDEFGVPLTVEKGIHQIDLVGDISGFLSSHPQAPLLSLHHLDFVNPIFPSMDKFQSAAHLMKAAKSDQSRLLQQTICYHRPRNWSFSISWGYSVHIYERIHPRSLLKRPLETFRPWLRNAKPPMFMFNTRWPCETPSVFFFESTEKALRNQIVTNYARSASPGYPNCFWKGNGSTNHIARIQVYSSATKRKEIERSECCDIIRADGASIAEVKLRACKDDEIIA